MDQTSLDRGKKHMYITYRLFTQLNIYRYDKQKIRTYTLTLFGTIIDQNWYCGRKCMNSQSDFLLPFDRAA